MRRFLTRWFLLNKRLFKKPVFVLILCMVPILIVALNAVTAHTDGFVKIALAVEDPADENAVKLADALLDSSEIVYFSLCDTPEEAEDRVRYGEADAAWIFNKDIAANMRNLVNGKRGDACVRIVEREETVALRLAREKLAAVLSSDLSFELMCRAYAEKISADYDPAVLRIHFDRAVGTGEVFDFRYASGESAADGGASYLMLPIRGVLAAAILLCGFAMAMFWLRDEEQMVFCRVSRRALPLFDLGYHLAGIVDIAVIVILSLYAAGLATTLLSELVSMAVYCLDCAVFVIFVRLLLRRAGRVAAAAPMIIIVVLVVNPVLVNLPLVYPVRLLTPVWYYLQASHDPSFVLYGLCYFGIVGALDLILWRISDRFDLRKS